MVICFTFLAGQDEGLEKLEETVISTKHIALAVNEELDLHTMLLVESFDDFSSLHCYGVFYVQPELQ